MCEKAMDMVPCIQWHGIASKALLMVTGKEMCGSNNLLSVLKWYYNTEILEGPLP